MSLQIKHYKEDQTQAYTKARTQTTASHQTKASTKIQEYSKLYRNKRRSNSRSRHSRHGDREARPLRNCVLRTSSRKSQITTEIYDTTHRNIVSLASTHMSFSRKHQTSHQKPPPLKTRLPQIARPQHQFRRTR